MAGERGALGQRCVKSVCVYMYGEVESRVVSFFRVRVCAYAVGGVRSRGNVEERSRGGWRRREVSIRFNS